MSRNSQAFTRLDLLATVFVLALLAAVASPALGSFKDRGQLAQCSNNLRRFGIALLSYADENNGNFPPRLTSPAWPERLKIYYKETNILACPSDGPNPITFGNPTNGADAAPRSYILNGWSDYFSTHGLPLSQPFPQSAILEPSQTILFGEKDTHSGHFWFDYFQGDDSIELEQARHLRGANDPTAGASNYTFADGSVRLLKFGTSLSPVNLWFVVPELRTITF